MKRIASAILISAAIAAGGVAAAKPTSHFTGYKLASAAHVTIDQARQTALKSRPGVITDQELEKEAGGSGLRYSFDIKAAGKTYEVGVDAQTGKVLENAAEGAHPD